MAYIGRDVQYGTLEKQDLVADGSQTVFTLNYGVATAASLLVSVGGVIQEPDTAYTVSGTQLTFTAAPDANDNIYVVFLGKELMDMTKKEIYFQTATGDGSNVNPITLTNSAENAHELMVMLNGVTQVPETDYTVDGTTLTFTTAPANGVNILVYHLGYSVALSPASQLPAAGTTGNVLTSDGTNWSSQAVPAGGVDGITTSAAGTAITLNADNSVNMGNQPYFLATMSAHMETGDIAENQYVPIKYDTITDSQGSGYNTTNYTYTVPVTGKYLFSGCIEWDIYANTQHAHAWLYTSNRNYTVSRLEPIHANMHRWVHGWGITVDMDAGDTATMKIYCNNCANAYRWLYNTYNFWSGILVA